MTYRADGGETTLPLANRTFAQYDIQLSRSNFAPGSLSTTFANNIGSDVVLVRSGALTVPAGSFPNSAGNPNPFGFEFVFSTPYTYNGGDLLITTRHSGNGAETRDFDAVTNSTASQGIGQIGNTATTGFQNAAPVVRLTATVSTPEPSTYAMMFVGLGMLVVAQRKKKKATA